jgi:phosphate transport system substrate-binding protein
MVAKAIAWAAASGLRRLLGLAAVLGLVAACQSQPLTVTRAPARIRLATSESCAPVARALAQAYEDAHPWADIELSTANSRLTVEALASLQADVALVPWLGAGATGVWSAPVARVGIAVVANSSLPLADLRLGHLYEMYRGRMQEWDGRVLALVSREAGSGTRAVFEQAALRGREMGALTAVVLPSTQAVLDYVAVTPDALGYVATTYLTSTVASLVQIVPVEGVLPTAEAIGDGSYPLWGNLYLAAPSEPTGELRDFAEWVLSPPGQAIIARFRLQ